MPRSRGDGDDRAGTQRRGRRDRRPFAETKEHSVGTTSSNATISTRRSRSRRAFRGSARFDTNSPDPVASPNGDDRRGPFRKTDAWRRGRGPSSGCPRGVGSRARGPHRSLGDFDLAEEAFQDAMVVALELWPAHGAPENPRRGSRPPRVAGPSIDCAGEAHRDESTTRAGVARCHWLRSGRT